MELRNLLSYLFSGDSEKKSSSKPSFAKEMVLVGLGNPEVKYEATRHNIGFAVIKALARQLKLHLKQEKKFNAFVVKRHVEKTVIHLLLPSTYMNNSGIAVKQYLDFYKLEAQNLVVIVDDIALDFGELRLKEMGSSGGHNGLKSIEAHLKTSHYARLRMGIGKAPKENAENQTLASYVLSRFSAEEVPYLDEFIHRGIDVLLRLVHQENLASVMNAVNVKKKNPITRSVGQEKSHEST